MTTYPSPTTPTAPAQPPSASQQPSAPVDVPPVPAPAGQPDPTLRNMVIGLLITVLFVVAGCAFYASMEHPSVASALQAMGGLVATLSGIASIASIAVVLLARRR